MKMPCALYAAPNSSIMCLRGMASFNVRNFRRSVFAFSSITPEVCKCTIEPWL